MVFLGDGGTTPAAQERVKVFSYNTLCARYATPQQYGYTPTKALSWDYRKDMILAEIEASQADFLCLQEIETEAYHEFFRAKLAYSNYKSVFWPKSRARTMSDKDAKKVDGCATFYNDDKYILLDKQLVDFANIAINRPDMKQQHDIFNRIMPRDHIAVVTFFENRQTGSRFIVANAHIYFHPAYADVKLIQTAILMDYVTKLAEKYVRWPACKDKKRYKLSDDSEEGAETPDEPVPEPAPSMEYTSSTQIPLIVCIDSNSLTDSGVYELLSQGSIPPTHPDLGNYKYGNFTTMGIQHPFSLRSSYAALDGGPDELPYTNYTPGFIGVIDYIWYSTNALEVTALLGPADKEYMQRVPGWPTYHFPSDHMALLSEFSVKGRKEKKSHPEPDFGPSSRRG
jgi:CCR4-NOT transcription complex subunit 6